MKRIVLALLLLPLAALAQPIEPTETHALLNGTVTDMAGTPSSGDIITFTGRNTGDIVKGTTDKAGKYSLLLAKGETYDISYRLFGDDSQYSEVAVPSDPGLMTFGYKIQYELPETYTLNDVHFDSGTSALKTSSYKTLKMLAEALKAKPSLVVEIAGHTDSDGSEASNLNLSQKRAAVVTNYLTKSGIAGERLKPVGYGESSPVASNQTATGKAQNRRTEVRILSR